MTPFTTVDHLSPILAVSESALPQQVIVTGAPSIDPADLPAQVTAGPAKVLLDHDLDPGCHRQADPHRPRTAER
jgi:hypothetical protein